MEFPEASTQQIAQSTISDVADAMYDPLGDLF
jgi:hypothetical protein